MFIYKSETISSIDQINMGTKQSKQQKNIKDLNLEISANVTFHDKKFKQWKSLKSIELQETWKQTNIILEQVIKYSKQIE